ncbi:MAG: DUF58 domain-containing protein [Chlamydiia bacterium]|nr:DUF58 domain-containing protein [Chlamydiia bacterium]
MLSKEFLKQLHRFHLKMETLSKDFLMGPYRSAFKGRGMEFEEVRPYQYGDDIRTIDWNVTARFHTPFVKEFREERDLTFLLIVDCSSSTVFGHPKTKREILIELASLIAFSAIENHDNIGLILFSDRVETYLPPKKGSRHVLRLIRELVSHQSVARPSNLKKTLHQVGTLFKKKIVCFLLSDFIFPSIQPLLSPLAKKHEMVSICVKDPLEYAFPDWNLMPLYDLETEKYQLIDTSKSSSRATERIEMHRTTMKKLGIDWIEIDTKSAYLNVLHKYFTTKKQRRR